MAYRVAVLTVSDTASNDAASDKSGPLIRDLVLKKGFVCIAQLIVPDEERVIGQVVKEWCQRGDVDWIITTGGTGFGVRDKTPEAIRPLLEREASGLVHLLLSSSLGHTPLAALSRPVAGTILNTLVVTLPGSTKAVRENLEALLSTGVAEHALELIRGGTGQKVHTALAVSESPTTPSTPGGHRHHSHGPHHDHHAPKPRRVLSNDPSLPASARHRESPYPVISFTEALAAILQQTPANEIVKKVVTPELQGYILAEDVYAPRDLPTSPTTNVDGYALRSTDHPGIYTVVTSQTHGSPSSLPSGTIYRINTGAPLPRGTDSVIMVEDTLLASTIDPSDSGHSNAEEKEVETLAQVALGENVRATGSDVRKGDLVMEKGEILQGGGGEIGTLAFVGCREISVYRKPVVALLSTGNELVDILSSRPQDSSASEAWTGIWDTNRPSLQAVLTSLGYEVVDLGIVTDDISAHVDAIRAGLERADILVTTGGTSMGASDLLKPVIEHYFTGMIHFGRVRIKPGKPTTFATIPFQSTGAAAVIQKPVFALPGNPASALVTFYIFVIPALRKMGGWPEERCQLPRVRVQLTESMRLDSRAEFHRVVIRAGFEGLQAFSTGGQRSSRVASLSGANGLVALPSRQAGGQTELQAGEYADAVVIGELRCL